MGLYVTTPIYYPNDLPHIGTAYPTIAADVLARWARLGGEETFMLTGTDEHGKKIENAACKQGLAPQEFVNVLATKFEETFRALQVDFNRFIRTTDPDHKKIVQTILQRIYDRGDIYPGTYEGWYCVECENYYVEDDLQGRCCPIHGKPVEWLTENCFYFRLSKYQQWLLDHYKACPDFVLPVERLNEVISFVRGGLENLCISRSTFTWGIEIPFAEGHITYVWFDALLNYLTGAGYLENQDVFERRWATTTHIIGKDILRFHAIIWPAMLKAAGLMPPRRIFAHGFWTVNGRKFSKSLGNAIRPEYLISTYGLEPLRYYLFREFAFGSDGDFSEANLVQRNNSELAQGLGNLVHRVILMIERYRGGVIPCPVLEEAPERTVVVVAEDAVERVSTAMKSLAFKDALEAAWSLVHQLNSYLNEREPWRLAKRDEATLLDTVLSYLAEGLRFLSVLIAPFIPESACELARSLGLPDVQNADTLAWGNSLAGYPVRNTGPLFKMLEPPIVHVPPPVEHSCSDEVHDLGISYCVVQINGVKIRKKVPQLEQRKRDLEARIRALGSHWTDAIPEVKGYFDLYARIGKQRGEIISPIELLSEYMFDGKLERLPRINTVVDLYNLYALETFLSIGAHDREKIKGPLRLEIAREAVTYFPLASRTPVDILPGEYYWHDDEHVLCRLDIKQGEATKVDEYTRHLVLIVQGNAAIPADTVRQQTEALCREIVAYCGGDYQILEGELAP